MVRRVTADLLGEQGDLLLLLGEQLKQPLVSIAQLTEIGSKDPRVLAHVQKALNTIDNVLLYRRLTSGQTTMKFEPVHVGSAIDHVMRSLEPQMELSGCQTEVVIQHSLQPADIDRRLFTGALLSLWQAFMSTIQSSSHMVCAAYASHGNIRVSLLSENAQVDELSLSNANQLSSQPVTGVAGPAMDLLAAQGMFKLAGSAITKSRRRNLSGLGVTLRTSQQLHLGLS